MTFARQVDVQNRTEGGPGLKAYEEAIVFHARGKMVAVARHEAAAL